MSFTDKDNLLGISWCDSAWIPILNAGNVLDYFSERSNQFYDRTCNNEIVKMQRLSNDQLVNMTGMEYILLHVQEPILYVIRKQHRHSAAQVTPIADYYIIAGVVYQAPDLGSVVNSRLLNSVNHLQSAFDECLLYTRYHPSKGYSWEFKEKDLEEKGKKDKKPDEPSSLFQRQRVDMLLVDLSKRFPPRLMQLEGGPPPQKSQNVPPSSQNGNSNNTNSNNSNTAGGAGASGTAAGGTGTGVTGASSTGAGSGGGEELVQIKQEPTTNNTAATSGVPPTKSSSGPGSNEPPPMIIKQEKMDTTISTSTSCNNSSSSVSTNSAPNLTGTGMSTAQQLQQGPNMKPPPEKRPRLL